MRARSQAAQVYILISPATLFEGHFLESSVAIKHFKLILQEDL